MAEDWKKLTKDYVDARSKVEKKRQENRKTIRLLADPRKHSIAVTAFEKRVNGASVPVTVGKTDSTKDHWVTGTIAPDLSGVEDMEAELIDLSVGQPGQFFSINLYNNNLSDWRVEITEDFLDPGKDYVLLIYRVSPRVQTAVEFSTS